MDISVIIPVFNEEENIETLLNEIKHSLKEINFEVIVVDDNSSDQTLNILKELRVKNKKLRILSHQKNYGQSVAIRTGIRAAKNDTIVTLDGDGQNDPKDILNLYNVYLQKIKEESFVLVAGHRVDRKDSWLKRISSKYANKVRSKILNDGVPDTGCGLKILSRKKFLELPFFNHIHRYIPALYLSYGGSVFSVAVNHRARDKGVSKYGFHNRFWVGIIDLLGVRWLKKRSKIVIEKEM